MTSKTSLLPLSYQDFTRAGSHRTRHARDLAAHFGYDGPDALLGLHGCAQELLTLTANPAALAAGAATYIGPILSIEQQPLVLALHYIPTIAGVTAAATLTFAMRRTDTPANIQTAVHLTATAETQTGPITMIGVVPFGIPAASGVDVQGSASAGAGTITCSATSPVVLAVVGLS